MFGVNVRVEQTLRKHGKAAVATVLSSDRRRWAWAMVPDVDVNPSSALEPPKFLWKLTVRVEPSGEPPFDADIEAWLSALKAREGAIVPVLYHPSDHRKVVFDSSFEAQQAARRDPRNVPPGPVLSAADLLASGQRIPGVLKSFLDTGTTPRSLGRSASRPEFLDAPRYWFVVDLQLPNLTPVEGRNIQVVPRDQVPNLAIGLKLACAVDPADPARRFVVDWGAIAH